MAESNNLSHQPKADPLLEPLISKEGNLESATPNVERQSGYATTSTWNSLFFNWIYPLLQLGNEKVIAVDDVPNMAEKDKSRQSFVRFQENWEKQKTDTRSVTWALWETYKGFLIVTGLLALVKTFVMYIGPLMLNSFVAYVGGRRSYPYEATVLVGALFAAKLIEAISFHQYNYLSKLLGLKVRSSLIGALYTKGLKLSSRAKHSHTTGEIVNYMSTDAQRLADMVWQLHGIWVMPLQIVLALVILFKVVGWAMLAGLGVMVFVMIANLVVATKQQSFMKALMMAKDKRMKATTEALQSMKVIKLYAWQEWFQAKIVDLRAAEVQQLSNFMYIAAVNIFLLWMSPLAVSVGTFGCMVLMGIELTPGSVFTAIATFRILQEPLRAFPNVISSLTQAAVSMNRIRSFLADDELQADAVTRTAAIDKAARWFAVSVEGGNFSWDGTPDSLTLKDINFQVEHGSRVAICGTVGSGKSSLLACILGEMTRHSGKVSVNGDIAYVAQNAWILNGTVKDNILFGLPFDKTRYDETLTSCSLVQDLELFTHGDETEIGERGINLSGGQKQRIQLARAVYQNKDIYLLDDPFSAVDAHTGTELFMNCILGPLASKTVILVTHQVEFLPAVDLILVAKDGSIVQSGRFADLSNAGTDFSALVDAHNDAMDSVDEAQSAESASQPSIASDGPDGPQLLRKASKPSMKRKEEPLPPPPPVKPFSSQLTTAEERESGRVSRRVYWSYLTRAVHGYHIPPLLLIQFLWQGLQLGSDWWLQAYSSPAGGQPISSSRFIQIYILLASGSALFVLARSLLVAWAGIKTTQAYFRSMLEAVFRAPMAFFDSTPIGRILSRASSDQTTLDMDIPFMFGSFLAISFALGGVLVVTTAVTWPTVVCVALLAILYIHIQEFYLNCSRELSRVNGITKAPIIQNFAESLAGASTIRAFNQQPRFVQLSDARVDANNKVYFHQAAANEWLGLRLELISAVVLSFSAAAIVFFPTLGFGSVTPGLAGLSLSYGLALNQILFYLVLVVSNLENQMVSVERVQQYASLGDSEAPLEREGGQVAPKEWPAQGTVELRQLEVRYRPDSPLVLRGITATFEGGQKIGVVGRTGSGKSTLIQALFRIVEPAGGRIVVDGVDIATLGLADLRSRLSIIPQEPTLFHGTVRGNLDPLGEYSDDDVWRALDRCQLSDAITSTGLKLDSPVQEGGENWSVGQRQLFCLGRALLRQSRVLVLDEATASVDTVTDAIIQRTIKESFSGSTVISVAHRIPTVIDADKVLVLDQGKVAEYDTPAVLLENKSSMFYKLVKEYSTRSSGVVDMAKSSSIENLSK